MSSRSFNDLEPTFKAINGFLPKRVQFRPSPVYPSLQLQLYDPLLFLHLAWTLQRCVLRKHSSTSENGQRRTYFFLEYTERWQTFLSAFRRAQTFFLTFNCGLNMQFFPSFFFFWLLYCIFVIVTTFLPCALKLNLTTYSSFLECLMLWNIVVNLPVCW